MGEGGQKVQISHYKSQDVKYSMVTTFNNTILHTLKLLTDLVSRHHEEKKINYVW